ncbi:hypothetical protein [Paenibacillus wulumuqiensis]|uniref:hypothetical protein n=1 Tax=Paenibacillus wulumuqiensis TaxID=1567107 RepID=UPI000697411F|nr:hypothetical protein [Paenibacillus wulumuqiensis]
MEQRPERNKKPWYKKWWVWLIILFVIGGIGNINKASTPDSSAPVTSGSNSKEAAAPNAEAPISKRKETPTPTVTVDPAEFQANVDIMTGGTFVKSAQLQNNQGHIKFYKSFQEYKQAHPTSKVTEEMYKDYFSTGDKIAKLLIGENARLLRKFPILTSSSMTIPYDGKVYTIDLKRTELNQYIGFPIESLQVEDGSWTSQFGDVYVYDKDKRQAFMDTFVTIQ